MGPGRVLVDEIKWYMGGFLHFVGIYLMLYIVIVHLIPSCYLSISFTITYLYEMVQALNYLIRSYED